MSRLLGSYFLKDRRQWDGALAIQAHFDPDRGWSPIPAPVFEGWTLRSPRGTQVRNAILDECGRTLWTDAEGTGLHRTEPDGYEELLLPAGPLLDRNAWPWARIAVHGTRLWVLDRSADRLLGIDLETGAPFDERGGFCEAVDLALDGCGRPHVLDARRLHRHDGVGLPKEAWLGYGMIGRPAALAVNGPGTKAWIVDADTRELVHVDLTRATDTLRCTWKELGCAERAELEHLVWTPADTLLALVRAPAGRSLLELDAEGFVISTLDLPEHAGLPLHVSASPKGIALVTGSGVASLAPARGFAGRAGVVLAPVLDGGERSGERWDRLELELDLPAGARLEVRVATSGGVDPSEEAELARRVEDLRREPGRPDRARLAAIDAVLAPHWSEPDVVRATGHRDRAHVLVGQNRGRYLWVRLALASAVPDARPALRSLRVFRPRRSMLEYLPPVFAQDPAGADFVERFLASFHVLLEDLDRRIDEVPRDADAARADSIPPELRTWLARWVDFPLEAELGDAALVRLLRNAGAVVRTRGTARGAARLIELLSGAPASVLPGADPGDAAVLDGKTRLGGDTRLLGSGPGPAPIGGRAILGGVTLGTPPTAPKPPPGSAGERIEVGLPARELAGLRPALERALHRMTPAHVPVSLVSATGGGVFRVGLESLGSDRRPATADAAHALGSRVVASKRRTSEPGGTDLPLRLD